MNFLDHATDLAKRGFHVFPLCPRTKLPAIKEFPKRATYDLSQLREWWGENPEYNIGISTSRFNGSQAVLAVDVDDKDGREGSSTLLDLELEGHSFPDTLTQETPSGGRHLLYRVPTAVRQGVDVLGRGLDIRSRGGYVVGKGSVLAFGEYRLTEHDLAEAPAWLIEACGTPRERNRLAGRSLPGVDPEAAFVRARKYLVEDAPLALEGQGGDATTFKVACRVKDTGVSQLDCLDLMFDFYNPKCTPPWSYEELGTKVDNAYRYGEEPIGVNAPEVIFDKVLPEDSKEESKEKGFIGKINAEYAYVGGNKGYVLHETTDEEGFFSLQHIDISTFHRNFENKTAQADGGKLFKQSEAWMSHPRRRQFDGLCFLPGRPGPDRFYNLWRGFAVQPLPRGEAPSPVAKKALDHFLEHSLKNICRGNETLHHWLTTYFAHAVQRPWEKPQVAIVLRGKKGTGKNILVETVGRLFGTHFSLTSEIDRVLGRFNSLLENKVMLVLDEAFWSGDKRIEGKLKDLITGTDHVIERKGVESFNVKNCLRVAILGNEKWLIPATAEERRFAVFDVGQERIQDRAYFKSIVEGMEAGGNRLLLRYLLDFDISDFQVGWAPDTEGLAEQKKLTYSILDNWWFDCLLNGRLSEEQENWPEFMFKEEVRRNYEFFSAKTIGQNTKRVPPFLFSRELKEFCPSMNERERKRVDGVQRYGFRFPTLSVARAEWDEVKNEKNDWPKEDHDE